MKNFKILLMLGLVGTIWSCSPTVSLSDMQKQEEKAREQLEETRETLVELTKMKEDYSEDHRDERIAALEKRDKTLKKDSRYLDNVESRAAKDAVEDVSSGVDDQRKAIASEISELQNLKRENWTSLRESINAQIDSLKAEIDRLTESLAGDKPIE